MADLSVEPSQTGRRQWILLLALTAAHFVLDSFPGLMHTLLPAFQNRFGLSVSAGAVLLTVFLVASNGIQVVIGHIRPTREKPLLLYAGLLLTCVILLFGVVPTGSAALVWLSLLALACGAGVGMTHPESLKAVHRLDGISPAVSSTVFMGGGIFGFAFGGWVGAHWFEQWGFAALLPFCGASVLIVAVLAALRVRLATEAGGGRPASAAAPSAVSFRTILTIAALTVASVQILMWIAPQHVSGLGGDLSRGGRMVSVFTLGGGLGGIVMARLAAGKRELKTVVWMLAAGIPFVVAYLLLMTRPGAWVLLGLGGFFGFGAYPLMVSAARHSVGPNLGGRMGLMVGGVWLFACILPMLLGPVVDAVGTAPILFCVPGGFVVSLLLAIRANSLLTRLTR